jgi:cytochrome c-type biogenesis protein
VAGSSTATVRKLLASGPFLEGSLWFRKVAGVAIGILGVYFVLQPFIGFS